MQEHEGAGPVPKQAAPSCWLLNGGLKYERTGGNCGWRLPMIYVQEQITQKAAADPLVGLLCGSHAPLFPVPSTGVSQKGRKWGVISGDSRLCWSGFSVCQEQSTRKDTLIQSNVCAPSGRLEQAVTAWEGHRRVTEPECGFCRGLDPDFQRFNDLHFKRHTEAFGRWRETKLLCLAWGNNWKNFLHLSLGICQGACDLLASQTLLGTERPT